MKNTFYVDDCKQMANFMKNYDLNQLIAINEEARRWRYYKISEIICKDKPTRLDIHALNFFAYHYDNLKLLELLKKRGWCKNWRIVKRSQIRKVLNLKI